MFLKEMESSFKSIHNVAFIFQEVDQYFPFGILTECLYISHNDLSELGTSQCHVDSAILRAEPEISLIVASHTRENDCFLFGALVAVNGVNHVTHVNVFQSSLQFSHLATVRSQNAKPFFRVIIDIYQDIDDISDHFSFFLVFEAGIYEVILALYVHEKQWLIFVDEEAKPLFRVVLDVNVEKSTRYIHQIWMHPVLCVQKERFEPVFLILACYLQSLEHRICELQVIVSQIFELVGKFRSKLLLITDHYYLRSAEDRNENLWL